MIRSRARPFGSLLRELPRFLRDQYTVQRSTEIVRRGLGERDRNFLAMAKKAIYGFPRSPYLRLLEHARCEFGDLERAVATRGLDAALASLRAAGAYVSFAEFKGREPIVRDGVVFDVSPEDFDSPLLTRAYRARTSGSTGASTPFWISLRSLADRIPHTMLCFDAHGLLGAPSVMWRETPPAPAIGMILEETAMGQRYERWFAPPMSRTFTAAVTSRLLTEGISAVSRASGAPIPRPRPLRYEDAEVIGLWAAKWLAARGTCVIRTGLSNAVRIAAAAARTGTDLSGAAFVGAGEPVTDAKTRAISATGAAWISNYTISEVGRVGVACAQGLDASDVHYAAHVAAVITHPRRVRALDTEVETFHFTSLLPGAPKILLNVETDDYGVLETRSCGCPLEAAGLTTHIRDIFSCEKLTGEGVTLVGSDMIRILEDVLPGRFGGTPVDYQLVEEEDGGRTYLTLLVSPRLAAARDEDFLNTILDALGDTNFARTIRSAWMNSNALRVRREQPAVAQGGKVRPLIPKRS